MFTGIIQAIGQISTITATPYGQQWHIALPAKILATLQHGASLNVDGVCLTVVDSSQREVCVDIVTHTLTVTNLADRRVGDSLNIERALSLGGEVGGHLLSGHVSTTATLVAVDSSAAHYALSLALDARWSPYLFERGFVALDGVSLTVAEVWPEQHRFKVVLIPETLRATTLASYRPMERINIEIEHQTQVLVNVLRSVLSATPNAGTSGTA